MSPASSSQLFFKFSHGLLWRCGILDKFFDKVDPGSTKGWLDTECGKELDCFKQKCVPVVDAFAQTLMIWAHLRIFWVR